MSPTELVDHIAMLLTQRPLAVADRKAFVKLQNLEKSGASTVATARGVLVALLTSPHFIYKSESPELTDVERAHRLSYFIWNSTPDTELLNAARSGTLQKDSSVQVERMLKGLQSWSLHRRFHASVVAA